MARVWKAASDEPANAFGAAAGDAAPGRPARTGRPFTDGASALAELCGARSRHQQLPAADRAPCRRRLSRRRRLFAHRPARRGAGGDRRALRGGDGRARSSALQVCAGKIAPAQGRRRRATSRPRRAAAPPIARTSSTRVRDGDRASQLEIISTAEEARLVVTGCAPLLAPAHPVRDRLRHRRRLDRDRLAAASPAAAGAGVRRSSARCRCRSAWSP